MNMKVEENKKQIIHESQCTKILTKKKFQNFKMYNKI